jgi:hypothetical protein
MHSWLAVGGMRVIPQPPGPGGLRAGSMLHGMASSR